VQSGSSQPTGVRPERLHNLRHSHGRHLLTAGVPLHIVSARLGHSSPTVTLNVYAHVLPRADEQAASAIAKVLGLQNRLKAAC
jgi:integrase